MNAGRAPEGRGASPPAALAHLTAENPNPVLRLQGDGQVVYANAASAPLLRAWGITEGGILPEPWQTQIRTALTAGTPRVCDCAVAEHVFALRLVPVVAEGCVNLYGNDITDCKRDEATLRLSQAVIERMTDAVFWAAPDGRLRYVNQAACQSLGYTRDELLGMNLLDVAADYSAARWSLRWNGLKQQRTVFFETRHRKKNGAVFPVEVRADYMQFDGNEYACGIARDISERKRSEEVLRESEARADFALTALQIGTWDMDLQDHTAHRSLIHDQIFGYPALLPNWTFEMFLAHVLPEDREMVERSVRAAIAEQTAWSYECRIRRADGEVRWIWVAGGQQRDAERQPVRLSGLVQDITERKHAAAALRESEELFAAVFQRCPIAMVLVSAADGVYRDVNDILLRDTGYTRAEVIGRTSVGLGFFPDPAERERLIAAVRRDGGIYGQPCVIRLKSGALRDTLISISGITIGGRQYFLSGILDITAHKRAEEAHARLATAVEQAAETIVITDTRGTILYANPAFEKSSGYTCTEALGQNPRVLKSGQQDAAYYRQMWTTLTAGQVWRGRFINRRKDGTLYEEDATISPMRDAAGTIVNYVAVKRDITRESQLENQLRQAQKMEAVGRLAGGVAHDFNNLLMGIMGYTELCREELDPAHPIQEWLTEITREAERSADITRQLLAFARKQTITPKLLDLNDAVAGMLKLLRRLIGEDVHLAWLPGASLPLVKIDPSQVDQILANLCVNARDAITGVGQITIATSIVSVDADYCAQHADAVPGAYVCLVVSDDGCGMDAATQAMIFEPFFTTKGPGKGTGLGLATVYGIVQQNHGFIHVYSESGRGTTFRLHLPAVASEPPPASAPAIVAPPRGRGENILLVEDEPAVRVTCRRSLESLGYRVLMAETPQEALQVVAQHAGDLHLLLTDVVMPGMDGRQLAEQLLAVRPGLKVLFMSGYTPDVIAQRGVLEQGIAFVAKPFTREDLAHALRAVLDRP